MQDIKEVIQPAAETVPVNIPPEARDHMAPVQEQPTSHETNKELEGTGANITGPDLQYNESPQIELPQQNQPTENISNVDQTKKKRRFSLFGFISFIINAFKKTQENVVEKADNLHAQHIKGIVHYGDATKAEYVGQASLQELIGSEVEEVLKAQAQNAPTITPEIPPNVTPIRPGITIDLQPSIENTSPSNISQLPITNQTTERKAA